MASFGQSDDLRGADFVGAAEVLEVRASRAALVRDFLATVTADELDAPRKNPHAPDQRETTRSCQ